MYFRMKANQILYVSAPPATEKTIETYIRQKADWILLHHEKIGQKIHLVKEDSLYYLGFPRQMVVSPIFSGKLSVILQDDKLFLNIKSTTNQKQVLDNFMKKSTTVYIDRILPDWIQKTGLIPVHYSVRKMKKWGACTKKGRLIFNSYLICLPPSLIEYIICHELVHLLHFNHSKKFHETVANFFQNVKKLEKELKMYVK